MENRLDRIRHSLLLLFIMILLLIGLFQLDWIWKLIYPLEYQEYILEYTENYNLDPDLVAALIFVESKFIATAQSHKGAMGLMQIMPDTGRWIASKLGRENFQQSELLKPEVNIEFGSWYLNSLNNEFEDELIIVLAAYNAGRGNVARWLEENWDGQHKSISELPFAETRNYIKQVLKVYEHYQKLYKLNHAE